MSRRGWWCVVVGLLTLVAICAAPTAEMARADGDFKVEGGAMRDEGALRNVFFYRVDYQGSTLKEYGKTFPATPDPNAVLAKMIPVHTDSADIAVHFERGNLSTGGDVFSAMGLKPIGMSLPALHRLRGSAQAFGSLDGKSTTYALGVETPPFHAPMALQLTESSIANWLVVGIQAERRRRDSTTADFKDASTLQARWFIGRGLGPRGNTAQQRRDRDAAIASVRARVHTYREAEAVDKDWKANHKGQQRPPMEVAIGGIVRGWTDSIDALPEPAQSRVKDDAEWWGDKVTIWASDETLPKDQPRAALWFDGYVRREYGANRVSDAALQLTRAQLQVWLSLENPDQGWITLAYINGFDQTTPGARKEQLMLTFGVSF